MTDPWRISARVHIRLVDIGGATYSVATILERKRRWVRRVSVRRLRRFS